MKNTCKHYRYLIPKEDADELEMNDIEYCEVCNFSRKNVLRCVQLKNRYANPLYGECKSTFAHNTGE